MDCQPRRELCKPGQCGHHLPHAGYRSDRDDTSDRETQSSYPVNDGTKQTQNGGVVLDKANARPGDTVKLSPKPEQGFDLDTIVVKDAKGKVTVEATFKPAESPKVPNSGQTGTGTDYTEVKQNDWYFEAVTYVSQNGLFQGGGNGRFAPNGTMTRAMLWTVVGRIDGRTLTGSTVYDDAQKWATDKGLSDGSSPGSTVTREQLITTLWRYAGSPKRDAKLDAFSDSSQVADYAKEAMAWAVERGLLQGENGTLAPHAGTTRAQVAAILMRYHQAKTP